MVVINSGYLLNWHEILENIDDNVDINDIHIPHFDNLDLNKISIGPYDARASTRVVTYFFKTLPTW